MKKKPMVCIETKQGDRICFAGSEEALGAIVDGIGMGAWISSIGKVRPERGKSATVK